MKNKNISLCVAPASASTVLLTLLWIPILYLSLILIPVFLWLLFKTRNKPIPINITDYLFMLLASDILLIVNAYLMGAHRKLTYLNIFLGLLFLFLTFRFFIKKMKSTHQRLLGFLFIGLFLSSCINIARYYQHELQEYIPSINALHPNQMNYDFKYPSGTTGHGCGETRDNTTIF